MNETNYSNIPLKKLLEIMKGYIRSQEPIPEDLLDAVRKSAAGINLEKLLTARGLGTAPKAGGLQINGGGDTAPGEPGRVGRGRGR